MPQLLNLPAEVTRMIFIEIFASCFDQSASKGDMGGMTEARKIFIDLIQVHETWKKHILPMTFEHGEQTYMVACNMNRPNAEERQGRWLFFWKVNRLTTSQRRNLSRSDARLHAVRDEIPVPNKPPFSSLRSSSQVPPSSSQISRKAPCGSSQSSQRMAQSQLNLFGFTRKRQDKSN